VVQVKNQQVMRVVPLENEAVNECWIADRDRYSYEALNSPDRLKQPMIKQGGQWTEVDWTTALEYVANGLKSIAADHGAQSMGALVSPHSTLEELYLAAQLMRGMGSDNIDHRLRQVELAPGSGVHWLGVPIAELSQLQRALVVGSNLRKDHPLFAQRLRQATRRGAHLHAITCSASLSSPQAWAMNLSSSQVVPTQAWLKTLADVAAAVAAQKSVAAPSLIDSLGAIATPEAAAIAKSLLGGDRKAVLLGNAAAHHPHASVLLAIANWIGQETGATVGYLTEAANTVGAQWVKAQPQAQGLNAAQMLGGTLKAVLLLNTEPVADSAAGASATTQLAKAQMVVTMSPFKANMEFSDVLLPVSPFSETSGTFVNAEGRAQSFHAVVKPFAETRPAWKVLRVLGNMLGLQSFEYNTSQEVLADATRLPLHLNNAAAPELLASAPSATFQADPVVASIYQLDGLVRRAPSLQLTADARQALEVAA
jgi:NADH-quinone oxidoreductase subunit G